MPELPEAETIVRGLRSRVPGKRIAEAEILRPDVLRVAPRSFRGAVRGRTVLGVERRGKNVILPLDGARVIAVNLGMTGRLLPLSRPCSAPPRADDPASPAASGHPAVIFHFQDGSCLVFDDTRRFGTVECLGVARWAQRSERMGPEPLSPAFSAGRLRRDLARSRAPIRSWLLDQRRVAGVGNIYANEALFLAGVHPGRPARDLTEAEAGALHRALRRVLREAIESGGTTLRDYRDADGGVGRFARRLSVYGRAGQPCVRCGTPILRFVLANRATFCCPFCQAADPAGRGDDPHTP